MPGAFLKQKKLTELGNLSDLIMLYQKGRVLIIMCAGKCCFFLLPKFVLEPESQPQVQEHFAQLNKITVEDKVSIRKITI